MVFRVEMKRLDFGQASGSPLKSRALGRDSGRGPRSLMHLLAGGLLAILFNLQPMEAIAAPDSTKVVGAGECAECHENETEAWKGSHHYATFKELPRSKDAKKIAEAVGARRVNRDGSPCLNCHFSSQQKSGKDKPIAGISCESCHGAAKEWIKRHSEYSGKKKNTETPEEAKKRWADAEAAGMIRPKMIYSLTKNCYGCHVVPDEELVNKGGHPAGSPFELVSWSQGEVRHNTWHNDGKENRGADANRRRLFYAVGVAVELESAIRALSKASQKDRYAVTMAKRIQIARLRARRLARVTKDADLQKIADAAGNAPLALGKSNELEAQADSIAKAAADFASKHDGSKLAAIDSFIPQEKSYKGDFRKPTGKKKK